MMSYYTNIALSTNFLSLRIFFLINKAFQDMTTVRIGHQESTSHTFVGMTDLWVRISSPGGRGLGGGGAELLPFM